MSVEIGSKMAADNSYGMNGDQRPVSGKASQGIRATTR